MRNLPETLYLEVDSNPYAGFVSQFTVSKLASQVGTSTDTLRYYERIGLLPEPDRSPAGYRLYGDDAADRVRFIKRAQRFGLRLEEIGELLQIREQGLCPCGRTKRLLEERVAELSEEMAALRRLRDDIQEMLDEHLPGADGDGWQCGGSLIHIGRRSNTERGNHRECF